MLRSTLMQVPRWDKLIVLGDFNARIGSDSKIWGNVMGKHGVGNINSNGHRLLSLCSKIGLFVTNTLFQLKHKHKTTWMHPRSKHWHLLDHVLVKAVDLQDVQITKVMRGAECWTDHRLVRTLLRIRIRTPARKQKPQRRLNVTGLGRGADLSSLRAAISSNLAQVSDCAPLPFQSSSDATKQWDTLSKAVMDAAVDTLGYSTRKHQDWFDSNDAEIETLLNEQNAAFAAKLRNPNSVELQRRWALQRSQLQKRLREMENTWWLSKATEIQNYADENMAHQFYQAINAVYGPKSHSTHPYKGWDHPNQR